MRYWLGCLALLSLLSLVASCKNENSHHFPNHILSLDPKNVVVEVGGTQTFTAIYEGVVIDPNDLTWRTDNDVIAGIDSQGVATGFSDGIAEVTATSDHFLGKRGETALGTAIIVVNKGVRRVEVDFVQAVALGGTYPYTATVHGVNLDPADRSVTWSIANTNIATVNSQGVVTGVAEGHTTVTATSDLDRSKSGTMRVMVTRDKFVNNVQVIPDRGTVTVGGKQTFTAIVSGANLDLADKTVTWSTIPIGNPWGFSGVVRVNAQGVVTGVTEGETRVYATSNFAPPRSMGNEGIAEIIVTSNKTVNSVTVTPANASVAIGDTQTFTATVNGINLDPADRIVTWSTADTSIATVNANGVVTGVAEGQTTITATSDFDNTQSGTATIVVTSNKIVSSVVVTPTNASVGIGDTQTLTATVNGINLDPADETVTWSVIDSSIAKISAQGVVTGIAVGQTKVTATSDLDSTKSGTATIVVTSNKTVSGVTVTPVNASLSVGDTQTLTATVNGANLDPDDRRVTWLVADTSIATISAQGVLTGVAKGQTTVTATSDFDSTKSGTATIVVTSNKTVTSVTVAPINAAVIIGNTQAFTATVNGINLDPADQTVTWSIADTSITTVNVNGVVTGVAEGQTTVIATSDFDNTKSGTATITVSSNKSVTSVTVAPANAAVTIGNTQAFTATVNGANLDPADQTVTWSIANSSIATVNANGVVTGVAQGQTTVTATSNFDSTRSGTATITVNSNKSVTSVTVAPANAAVTIGNTQAFTATVNGANLDPADQTVTWSIANSSIATVNANGVVTGVAVGQTTVTATSNFDNTKSGTATVKVTNNSKSVSSVVVTPEEDELPVGGSTTLTATVNGVNLDPADTTVTWSVANSSIATVNANGVVTGAAQGRTTVTATSDFDNTKSDSAVAIVLQR